MDGPKARAVPSGFPWKAALALACVAIVLRVGTNLSRVDEPSQEVLVRGVVAQMWIDGVPVWPARAPQIPHVRGSLVISALAVPCFAIFGPTTFALRLASLPFHLAGMLLCMLLVHRLAGRLAAALAGALWVCAPPALATIAVAAYGDHVEGVPLVLATAWLLGTWTDARSGGRQGLGFLAGLAAGLGIAWHAQSRLGVLAVLVALLLLSPRRLLHRDALTGLLPGLLAGLLPMAIGDWITASDGLAVFDHSPADMVSDLVNTQDIAKAWRLWSEDFAAGFQYPWPVAGIATLLLSLACALGLLVAAARRGRTELHAALRAAAPFVAWVLAFTAAYAGSRFRILHAIDNPVQVRFVLPVLTLFALPIAVAGAALWRSRHRALAGLVVGPALLLGTAGSLSTLDPDTMLHEPARRAVSWADADPHLIYGALDAGERTELRALELSLYGSTEQRDCTLDFARSAADPELVLARISQLEPAPPELHPLLHRLELPAFDLVAGDAPELPDAWRPWALAQAGVTLGRAHDTHPGRLDPLLRRCRSQQERTLFARAFGAGIASADLLRRIRSADMERCVANLPAAVERTGVAFGIGLRIGRVTQAFHPRGDALLREALAGLPARWHGDLARGLGAGYRLRFLDPPRDDLDSPAVLRLVTLLAETSPELERPFREGLGEAHGQVAQAASGDGR